MNNGHNMEETLWNYIDATLRTEERKAVEQLLQSDMQWKNKYTELAQIHHLMQHVGLEEPSMRFTLNVMEQVSLTQIAPATSKYLDKNIIRGIGLFFLTAITGFLVYGWWNTDLSQRISFQFPLPDHLSFPINWSSFFGSNYIHVFMGLNAILALALLDIYLTKKKKETLKY